MSKTVNEIAEEAMPGWRVVKANRTPRKAVPKAQLGTPDLAELRRRYLGETPAISEGFVPASSMADDDTEYVEMEPQGVSASGKRRVVIISKGKAVAIQG
jgi:hypothetical protein